MKFRYSIFSLVLAAGSLAASTARADITLSQAIEIAIRGKWANEKTQSVSLNGHGFYIRKMDVQRRGDMVTAEGYFRHRHRGKDDRVYYRLVAVKGRPYQAVITKIHYRGLFTNKVVQLGANAVGAYKGGKKGVAVARAILKALGKLQSWADGPWEVEAAKIVDAMGARLAREVQ